MRPISLLAACSCIAVITCLDEVAHSQSEQPAPQEQLPETTDDAPPADTDEGTDDPPSQDDATPETEEPDAEPQPSPPPTAPDDEEETSPTLQPSPVPRTDPIRSRDIPPLQDPVGLALDGVLFRAGFGFGGVSVARENVSYGGVDGGLSLSLGHSVADKLYISIRFGLTTATPNQFIDGQEVDGPGDVLGLTTTTLGVGATYYLPRDFRASAAVTAGWLGFEDFDEETRWTKAGGFGLETEIGKEWFFNPEWGVGAALGLRIARYPDPVLGGRWTGVGVLLTGYAVRVVR